MALKGKIRAKVVKSASSSLEERAVKRSVSVRRDLDDAVLEIVGDRKYSAFINEALVLALRAEGVLASVASFEHEHGVLTDDDKRMARQRRALAAAGAG